MKRSIAIGIAGICCLVLSSMADTVTASSDPFSFPVFTSVKTERAHLSSHYIKFVRNAGSVTLSWAFPKPSESNRGVITFFSLNGQKVKEIPIASLSGSAQWKASKEGFSGVAVARVSYGTYLRTLKLVLW